MKPDSKPQVVKAANLGGVLKGHVLHPSPQGPVNNKQVEDLVVGDPGIEPGVSRLEGVTVPCHTLRPVAQHSGWILGLCGPVKRKSA